MQKDRHSLVLYTTAVCNLNCVYCYIDKNPALKEIDDILDESFKGDYYFNFAKKMFPNRTQLTSLEIWGGEPFLRMDRVYGTLHKLINHYPFLEDFFSSTNFAFDDWIEQFFGLMLQFDQYPNRKFKYHLQLSLDGPEYITDAGRGKGTTAKCLANLEKFFEQVGNRLPSNIELFVGFKPTLDLNTTKLLCDEQKLIEYYQFFDNLIDRFDNLGYANVHCNHPIPNTACPSPVTVEDGKIFAKFAELSVKISKENKEKHYFKHYTHIIPFYSPRCDKRTSYRHCGGTCGSGRTILGLLPNDMISTCHNGFVDLISSYKEQRTHNQNQSSLEFKFFMETAPTRFTLTMEDFEKYEQQVEYYYLQGTTARLANNAALVAILAYAGQIDEKYKDETAALEGAIFVQNHTSYCMRDNHSTTGSLTLSPVGLFKLLLNGAREFIEEGERIDDEECKCI